MDGNGNGQFDKLLLLTEKSVTAWEKAYQKIDHLIGENEIMRTEMRALSDGLKVRPCMIDDSNKALKNQNLILSIITGMIVLASTIIGIFLLIKK